MKLIVVKTNNTTEVKEFSLPLYQSLGEAVGGYFEVVRPRCMPKGYCFVCNDNGHALQLSLNLIASALYGHGPVVGDIVICLEGFTEEGPDFIAIDDKEFDFITQWINKAINVITKASADEITSKHI